MSSRWLRTELELGKGGMLAGGGVDNALLVTVTSAAAVAFVGVFM